MDRQSTYTLSVLAPDLDPAAQNRNQTLSSLREFVLDFRLDNAFIYRDQIRQNVLLKQYYCDVDIAHLISYDEDLAHRLVTAPGEIIPLFELALKQCTHRIVYPSTSAEDLQLPEHQLLLHSSSAQTTIRDLNALQISRLVRIPGIIIGASTLSSKATVLHLECRNCHSTEDMQVTGGFSGLQLPRTCSNKRQPGEMQGQEPCPLDPYFIVHDKCQFVDHQILKIQEAPDQVPVGELPRHMLVSADRYLTNRAVPGTRCVVHGIYTIYEGKKSGKQRTAVAIRTPYLRAVGIHSSVDMTTKGAVEFTEEEEQEFLDMARRPDIYDAFVRSIAPSIYGNNNIKKAIACLLMGGSKKQLPDGMRLRGDINVLMLGDPGTAKSQLLKFVEKVSPIAIYTSGKGSSAAGLTASVQRDASTREFYLEGGAMVLADQGVVCIDEFDKMRDEDRIAIHEAMEQQTISIAKAGITTILNSRTAVLAAANPLFGRYDDFKTPGENIDFQTTILSRFDMIFIVKDEHDRARDEKIAKHVMNIQMGKKDDEMEDEDSTEADFSVEKMKRYIQYCKSHCAPRLSAEAAEKLSAHFVSIRRQVASTESADGARSSIPITVRQLEAITRISEALAKLTLGNVVTPAHVDEAIRLFLASTMDAVVHSGGKNAAGAALASAAAAAQQRNRNGGGGNAPPGLEQLAVSSAAQGEQSAEAERMVDELRRRLPIGWSTSLAALRREMCDGRGFSDGSLTRALMILQRRGTLVVRNAGSVIHRTAL